MIPNFVIFGKTISIYMVVALLGVFSSLLYTYKLAIRQKCNEIDMLYLMLISFAAGTVGAHILYGFTNFNLMINLFLKIGSFTSFEEFVDACVTVFGGAVYYGGLIGVLIAAFIHMKKSKNKDLTLYDIGASAIPLFHAFGRIGCFLSGCCYGTESKFGFIYHYAIVDAANGVTRFPIQLFEAGFNAIIFFILFILLKKQKCKGKLIAVYLLIYSPIRFVLEFFRGDDYRGFVGIMSTSQFISLILFVSTVSYLTACKIKSKIKNKSRCL